MLAEAAAITKGKGEGIPLKPQDVIRRLAAAADPPKKSGSPKKSDQASAEVVTSPTGRPLFRVEPKGKKDVNVTLLLHAGGSRTDAERAFTDLLARFCLKSSGAEPV